MTSHPPIYWWCIPKVQERNNYLITGDCHKGWYSYVHQKYFDQTELRVLSLACGTGEKEIGWALSNAFSSIDAYDFSDARINYATEQARIKECGHIVTFKKGDARTQIIPEKSYDVIFSHQALHHFSSVEEVLHRAKRGLKKGGYLIVNEYVGPDRFQWTKRQVEVANALLGLLPKRYKKRYQSAFYKTKIYSPGKLAMMINDPSEAVESSRISPLLKNMFNIEELKNYGGTILHLLFDNIAHHFLSNDISITKYLDLSFMVEDLFLEECGVKSDFIFAVCKK